MIGCETPARFRLDRRITLYFPDYHIHTTLCKHAVGGMEEYVERAIELGLREIGFADHMPVMPEPQFCMDWDDLPVYIDRVHAIQDRYSGRIDIRLGCEMDIAPGREDEIRSIIERYDFDYVIGSVHYLDGWPFDQEKHKGVFEKGDLGHIYDLFFETVIRAARTGLYDIAGHIDNIKRMGYVLSGDLTPYYTRTAAVLKEMNVAFELNTSGYDSAAAEAYPSPAFLRVLCEAGVPVTLGSDSHSPDQVGRHFSRAFSVLHDAGYDSVTFYKGRGRIMRDIPEKGTDGNTR